MHTLKSFKFADEQFATRAQSYSQLGRTVVPLEEAVECTVVAPIAPAPELQAMTDGKAKVLQPIAPSAWFGRLIGVNMGMPKCRAIDVMSADIDNTAQLICVRFIYAIITPSLVTHCGNTDTPPTRGPLV